MIGPREWSPPFCANDVEDVPCPVCEGPVRIRAKETYYDGEEVEAYCGDCRVKLTIYASVDIAFSSPEVAT